MRKRLLNLVNAVTAWRAGQSAAGRSRRRGRWLGVWAFAIPVASIVELPAVASAGQSGWFTLRRAGSACKTQGAPHVIALYSSIYNNDILGPHTVWCPVDNPNGTTGAIGNLDVWANAGWIDPGFSCVLSELNTPNAGWWFNAKTVNHYPEVDDLSWAVPVVGPLYGAEVECIMPSGQQILGYDTRAKQYFDWTDW
jgi:hypothetical protein